MQREASLKRDPEVYTDPHNLRYALHNRKPDYSRDLLEIPPEEKNRIRRKLECLYGTEKAGRCLPELERLMQVYHAHKPDEMFAMEENFNPRERFTQDDIILITYGDLFRDHNGSRPLNLLGDIMQNYRGLSRIFNTLHILPFFPYSSDRGFAVTNFRDVNPQMGTWEDIEQLSSHFQLMFDGVFNHTSSQSPAFERFLNGDPNFRDVFIAYDSPEELTDEQRAVLVRPRTSDVLSRYETLKGPKWVWTTFSKDQIDLNFHNPKVLLWIVETMLMYVRNGANLIRLDAVTYLWSEPGTCSANMDQDHIIVKLLRDILNVVAPGVALITETNVPHRDNVAYFGNGSDEAQMVYNFALPPLVLHSFYRGDCTALTDWAARLEYPSDTATFFNILDTHDGIGLMGVRNILPQDEIDFVIDEARDHGAFISYKTGENGAREPYEINSTWFSALNRDGEDMDLQVKRFVASRSIALALRGVPGIYLHGLIGTRNDTDKALVTKTKRDINRKYVDTQYLLKRLKDPESRIRRISQELPKLTDIRRQHRAFHPNGAQHVLDLDPKVFALLRQSPEKDEHILALTNVSDRSVTVAIPLSRLESLEIRWFELVEEEVWHVHDQQLEITLEPYAVRWLMPFTELERCLDD